MSLLHLVIVALVQGITEFLPVSSSGHLVLIHHLAAWPDQGLAIDVAAHVGSLAAVLLYFRRDITTLAGAGIAILTGKAHEQRRLLWLLIVASIPALAAGALINAWAGNLLRGLEVIAWAMTAGGILLYAADQWTSQHRTLEVMRFSDGLVIGCAQMLALVPGSSRAGVVIIAARALGFTRVEAARFSMLLSIPVILGAAALQAMDLASADVPGRWADALAAAALSAVAAFATVAVLMRWLTHASFTPLVIYRLALGVALLALVYL